MQEVAQATKRFLQACWVVREVGLSNVSATIGLPSKQTCAFYSFSRFLYVALPMTTSTCHQTKSLFPNVYKVTIPTDVYALR